MEIEQILRKFKAKYMAPGMGFEPMSSRGALVHLPLGLQDQRRWTPHLRRICPDLATPAQDEMLAFMNKNP